MKITETIQQAIEKALAQIGAEGVSFSLEHPTDLSHGDYATNAALASAKALGKNPREVADLIVVELKASADLFGADEPGTHGSAGIVSGISVAGPGFINFTLSHSAIAAMHNAIESEGDSFGSSGVYVGKKILVEHSSPNLFKPFHIGHMMNNAIGESLVRLMKFSGADVVTTSFPSDISLGVAKAIFIILEKHGENFEPADIASLGEAYVEGTKRYEEDEAVQARVKEIADNLYAQKPSPEWDVFCKCKAFNIAYFESVVEKLGSHFDFYVYESEAGVDGKKIVEDNVPSVFTKSEGAIVYVPDESDKHLNTAVFVNSQGNPTYEAKDIGLIDLKFNRVHPDLSLFVTDHEQIPHFQIVLDAAQKIGDEWKKRVASSVHIAHGRMKFKGEKMSSRLGGVALATDMIGMVAEEARERAQGRDQGGQSDQSEAIAIAAIKFAVLRAKPGQNINFDPDESLSFEGDSGPYLQYTHARIGGVLEKGAETGLLPKYGAYGSGASEGSKIYDVERVLAQFPDVVNHAIAERGLQHIVTYLLELSRSFNSFYGANKIVDAEQPEQSRHRLAIARSVRTVVKNGLWLIGIVAPERM